MIAMKPSSFKFARVNAIPLESGHTCLKVWTKLFIHGPFNIFMSYFSNFMNKNMVIFFSQELLRFQPQITGLSLAVRQQCLFTYNFLSILRQCNNRIQKVNMQKIIEGSWCHFCQENQLNSEKAQEQAVQEFAAQQKSPFRKEKIALSSSQTPTRAGSNKRHPLQEQQINRTKNLTLKKQTAKRCSTENNCIEPIQQQKNRPQQAFFYQYSSPLVVSTTHSAIAKQNQYASWINNPKKMQPSPTVNSSIFSLASQKQNQNYPLFTRVQFQYKNSQSMEEVLRGSRQKNDKSNKNFSEVRQVQTVVHLECPPGSQEVLTPAKKEVKFNQAEQLNIYTQKSLEQQTNKKYSTIVEVQNSFFGSQEAQASNLLSKKDSETPENKDQVDLKRLINIKRMNSINASELDRPFARRQRPFFTTFQPQEGTKQFFRTVQTIKSGGTQSESSIVDSNFMPQLQENQIKRLT